MINSKHKLTTKGIDNCCIDDDSQREVRNLRKKKEVCIYGM